MFLVILQKQLRYYLVAVVSATDEQASDVWTLIVCCGFIEYEEDTCFT